MISRVLTILLVALLLTGCDEPTQKPPVGVEVTVVTLQSQPVTLERELTGRLHASVVAEVRPQVTGIIQQRRFEEGGLVEEGQALYQLDDAKYRTNVARAEASVARSRAALDKARANASRADELIKIKAISAQFYDDTMAALREAEADVKVAQAELEQTQVVLGYATIRSPISGRIGKSSVTRGALVTEHQDLVLAKVQQLDPMYVDLSQSSKEFLQLRQQIAEGQLEWTQSLPVTLILEDGSRYPHSGKLVFREVSVDPTTGSYILRIIVDNPEGLLLPGMYVRAKVPGGLRPEAVLAPQQGIMHVPGGEARAMVVNDNDQVELRDVRVSQAIGDKWLVESGLAAGDRIIVEGLQKIKLGMPVNVSEVPTGVGTIEDKR